MPVATSVAVTSSDWLYPCTWDTYHVLISKAVLLTPLTLFSELPAIHLDDDIWKCFWNRCGVCVENPTGFLMRAVSEIPGSALRLPAHCARVVGGHELCIHHTLLRPDRLLCKKLCGQEFSRLGVTFKSVCYYPNHRSVVLRT